MAGEEGENPEDAYILRRIADAADKERGYASYWQWPEKSLVEVEVVRSLFNFLAHDEGCLCEEISPQSNDPPDVLALADGGIRIGVEVTELVDGDTAARHRYRKRKGEAQIHDWPDYTIADIARLVVAAVEEKDQKLKGRTADFDKIYVAIHTDEGAISIEMAREAMRHALATVSNVDRAFLLKGYHPGLREEEYPGRILVLQVPLETRSGGFVSRI